MATSTRSALATAAGLPVVLLLVLLTVVSSDPAHSCATPLVSSSQGEGDGSVGAQLGLTERQLQLARQGVAIGLQRRMPEQVIIAELAAQATESSFRNLANPAVPQSLAFANDGLGYDHDSVGPHQIRVSIHGSVGIAALMNPDYQIHWFYDKYEALGRGADAMSPAELAQAIERSEPNAYARHLGLARQLYATFADLDPSSMPRPPPGQPGSGCGPTGSGAPLTTHTSAFGQAVIDNAARWIGTPYVWGGGDIHGPTGGGFDCSGLTLYAVYHASGGTIRLPHYTQAQQDHTSARVVAFSDRAPGDLIFFTSPGARDSHHVGIYYGRNAEGTDLLLHAPQSGQTVTIAPMSDFAGERMDLRRYTPPQGSQTNDRA